MTIKSKIKFKGFNNYELLKKTGSLQKIAESKGLDAKISNLPTKRKKVTVLKSPHVHKKARDQFELTIYTQVLLVNGEKTLLKLFLRELTKNSEVKYSILLNKKN